MLGVLLGALLGALGTLAVVHAQQPDKAAAFLTEQRLAAYRAYAEQVASTNDVVDQAMASAERKRLDLEIGEGSPIDPTGATPQALDLAQSRLDARTRDVEILASRPVREAYDANRRAQDDVITATRALFADSIVPSVADLDAVETKVLAARRVQAPATLVAVVSQELAAGS